MVAMNYYHRRLQEKEEEGPQTASRMTNHTQEGGRSKRLNLIWQMTARYRDWLALDIQEVELDTQNLAGQMRLDFWSLCGCLNELADLIFDESEEVMPIERQESVCRFGARQP